MALSAYETINGSLLAMRGIQKWSRTPRVPARLDIPVQFFSALQLCWSRISVAYDSKLTLTRLECRKISGQVVKSTRLVCVTIDDAVGSICIWYIRQLQQS